MKKHIYIIGIGGIGISGLARYYLHLGWKVSGSDKTSSSLIEELQKEGCDICIGERPNYLENSIQKIIYSQAIPKNQSEYIKGKKEGIDCLSYPQALGEIANQKKLITVAGTHGKSTTASLASIVMKKSSDGINAIIGTLLKEFGGKNTYFEGNDYFLIEACEYKRSFLNYKPTVGVITNIEVDHLDYFKNDQDYLYAFEEYINNICPNGFVIINGEDKNCKKIYGKRKDIQYIEVYSSYFTFQGEQIPFPDINLKVAGKHILYDAHIAYILGNMTGIDDKIIINSLETYTGAWRRMEIIGNTKGDNILMSDYAHHPTEILCTLKALKDKYKDKKLLTIFQPHQYSRTIELLDDFVNCFSDTDTLIIPNIYESRDSIEHKKQINTEKLIQKIKHPHKINGKGLKNTLSIIEKYDLSHPHSSIIVLLGAGDVDTLREQIKMEA